MKSIMGFIPAGGRGTRMKPFNLIKELLPVIIREGDTNKTLLLIENAIEVLKRGHAENTVCVLNKDKEILMRTITDYIEAEADLNFSFVFQKNLDNEYGLPFAIEASSNFLKGNTVFMKFPDTIVYPLDCFDSLYQLHKSRDSDLTLGVFYTENAKNLGPVVIDADNRVLLIEDKPLVPSADNTWNVLIWEDEFIDLVVSEVKNYRANTGEKKELLLHDIMNQAIENELKVYAKYFDNSECIDVSCINDAKDLWFNAN